MLLALPAALLLLIPAGVAWWWLETSTGRAPGAVVRAIVLFALILAAARPQLIDGQGGSDVVLVLDRSASMGVARERQEALLRQIGDERRAGDRLAVVSVGATARVLQAPRHSGLPRIGDADPGEDGSELSAGLDAAAGLIAPGRSGRVVLISDGETTGYDPRRSATALHVQRIPVDVLPERLGTSGDAAVLDLEIPGRLRLGASFIAGARIIADRPGPRAWQALRVEAGTSVVLAQGTVDLAPLRPAGITFADRPPRPGVATYRVELVGAKDREPGNDVARAPLLIQGGETVLVVGGDGEPGNVSRALEAAGLTVRCRAAGPLGLGDLAGVQALVLDQVPADRLGASGLAAVAGWVRDLGGGLIMGGGRLSFGQGGYRKSPVEDILPVSLEIRDEHRKLATAMAIALDRSGSMGVPVGGGRTKMDLADEGAAAAIELLGPRDHVAVLAVDSEPHVVIEMQPVKNAKALAGEVLGIQSQGGGIYCYQALLGAGDQVLKANTGTKHIVLFADANDAEEPGDYKNLLAKYRAGGITVSVVAMGTQADSDAAFLEDIALRGGGRITFASDVADLPRLFAQETVLVARSAWIDQAVAPQPTALLGVTLGISDLPAFPAVAGYNLTYPRERAQVLGWCPGDPKAPAMAAWSVGTGRSLAIPLALDDAADPALPKWPGYARWLASAVRWAAGSDATSPGQLTAERTGRSVTWRLELDPDRPAPASPPALAVLSTGGQRRTLPLVPIAAQVWEAEDRLDDDQVRWGAAAVDVGDGVQAVVSAPICLPCPVEAEPRFGRPSGESVLAAIARDGGGVVRGDLTEVFANPPSPGDAKELAPFLVAAAILLLVAEIALRRWRVTWIEALGHGLLQRWRRPRPANSPTGGQPVPASARHPGPRQLGPAAEKPAAPSPPGPVQPPAPDAGDGLHDALKKLRRR